MEYRQLADMVSGLRRVAETARIAGESNLSPFKHRLFDIGKALERLIRYDETITISRVGETG